MADPRQAARAWLAEQIREKQWIRTTIDGMTSIGVATAEDLADAILSPPGVEVDQFAVLDGATLNLKGKRVRLTLPVMTFEPGAEKWVFEPPKPIGEAT